MENKDITNLIEDENKKDKKYFIIEKKGSGVTTKVFVVETLDRKTKVCNKSFKSKR